MNSASIAGRRTRKTPIAKSQSIAISSPAGRHHKLPAGLALVAALAILPVAALAVTALMPGGAGAGALGANMLGSAFADTALLLGLVGLGTTLIGTIGAWLVSYFNFPGRRLFNWLLVLPLAVPTYLSAYSWVEFADYAGPVQSAIRALSGAQSIRDYWFPDIRTTWGAAAVMTLVLYPYVYLSCRTFFLMQSGAMAAAARTLGAGPGETFRRIVMPLARPAIVVGVTLALLEVVNDLGAVQYFGVNSLTALIYSTWLNRSNFAGAAQLALAIVALIVVLIWFERWARAGRGYLGRRDSKTPPPRQTLKPGGATLAVVFCALATGLGFGVPFGQLAVLAIRKLMSGAIDDAWGPAFANTAALGLGGAALCVTLGYYSAWQSAGGAGAGRKLLVRLATLGYALPGTVLALGLIYPLGYGDGLINAAARSLGVMAPGLVLSGSVIALLYAYSIRFLALGHNTIEAARERRGSHVLDAARVLGVHGIRLIWRVDLPTLTPALLGAATLVVVECIKELPATLLLRPLGVETLATIVYQRANSGLFSSAALPALAIIAAGVVPVIMASGLAGKDVAGATQESKQPETGQ